MIRNLIIFIILISHFQSFGDTAVLRLYLPFDEGKGSTVYDKAAGLKAELHNTLWCDGKSGNAISFRGGIDDINGSYICLPETRGFERPMTIEMWIKPDAGLKGGHRATIIGTTGYTLAYFFKRLDFMCGKSQRLRSSTDSIVIPGEWNHISVVWNEKNMIMLYINGRKAGESKKPFIPINGVETPLVIGSVSPRYYHFIGSIDEVKIYEGARTPMEILKSSRGL